MTKRTVKWFNESKKAQKMESIGNLAGGIAHDFNNLLCPIIGMSEMLLEDLPENSPEYEKVREILKAGLRGGDLVKQFLAFSCQSKLKKKPIRIQHVLKDVIKLCRSTFPADVEIIQDIQRDCGLVMANATQIHQVAMNLSTNAYHAIESSGGKIKIHLSEILVAKDNTTHDQPALAGKYALLKISDTGNGIDQKIQDKIFEPYFTTKEKGKEKGTGLGLAVVYGIVKESGGEIFFETQVGKGTSFNVYFPLIK